jgi:hypothetical protein
MIQGAPHTRAPESEGKILRQSENFDGRRTHVIYYQFFFAPRVRINCAQLL